MEIFQFIICSSSVTEFAAMLILVSSANILGEALSRQLGKSFMYIKNNRGPKLLPCGTPQVILAVSDQLTIDATSLTAVA